MKLEERVTNTVRTNGTMVFMNAIIEDDDAQRKHGAWLLTFGLLETFKITRGISNNDNTF